MAMLRFFFMFYLHFKVMYQCEVIGISQANQLNTIAFGLATTYNHLL